MVGQLGCDATACKVAETAAQANRHTSKIGERFSISIFMPDRARIVKRQLWGKRDVVDADGTRSVVTVEAQVHVLDGGGIHSLELAQWHSHHSPFGSAYCNEVYGFEFDFLSRGIGQPD